tara:strand:- start:1041 stop:1430 length:390 start_codon:yes stop_codon:yes gene_type:complete
MESEEQVKTFISRIEDEYGRVYPEALVAVLGYAEHSTKAHVSNNCKGFYSIDAELEAITYNLNYYHSTEKESEGFRSHPLYFMEDGKLTGTYTVDLDHEDTIQILNGSLDYESKLFQCIQADTRRNHAA